MITIPRSVIPRLSVYFRVLLSYEESAVISSERLSALTGHTAAQIRRDLAYFGQFGTRGKGYSVSGLKKEIPGILGIDRPLRVAIVGAGNLGMALLSYRGFREQGFSIVAAFDNDQRKIGGRFRDVVIQDIAELAAAVRTKKIEMAVVAVPAAAAATAITALIRARVGAILNFAPVRLQVPSTVELINIDLSIELEKLAHFLRRTDRHREPIAGSSGGPHAKRKR